MKQPTLPNSPASELSILEMFSLEIMKEMISNRHYLDMPESVFMKYAKDAKHAAYILIDELNKK